MPFSFNPLLGVGLDKSIPLDGAGKIPSTFLPSYVDDVEEYNNLAAFPATGETGKIYVAIDTGFVYRWSGSIYVQIGVTAAAGSTTQVQFNDGGAFGGDAGLVFDKTTDALTIAGPVVHPIGAAATPSLTFTGDPNTGIYSPGADTLALSTGGTERARIDSSGRLLVGTSTARSSATQTWLSQIEAVSNVNAPSVGLGIVRNQADIYGGYLSFAKTRGTSNGATTIVTSGDELGGILFSGADGSDLNSIGASIVAVVDGTPGANDMPGRLVFSTTADSAVTATERLRITSAGVLQVADAGNITVGTTTGTKIGTATTQKLGFWDKSPVVQPTTAISAATFVADSGGSIHPTSTFDGYTIAQVVAALRSVGILA